MKDELIVEERMQQFSRDVLHWINYDYVVINDDLNTCYNNIIKRIKNDKLSYNRKFIQDHVKKLLV